MIDTSRFLALCLETAGSLSREFSEGEVRQVVHSNRMQFVMEYLWEFTGHFYKWPEALLTQSDLPGKVKEVLETNLRDELGGNGGIPHTILFSGMARSIGVLLPTAPKQGPFIRQVLSNAVSLECPRAVGQFFANEATPKWGGFISALKGQAGADLEFFRVHANEDQHYLGLIDGFPIEGLPWFWTGAIEFAKLRASFMDNLRDALSQRNC